MAALATQAQAQARSGLTYTGTEQARLLAFLDDASAAVRSYTNQYIEAVPNDSVRLKIRRGVVMLPQRPVTAVDSVKLEDTATACLYRWAGDDRIYVSGNVPDDWAWQPFRSDVQTVTVVYDHGYATIPGDIVAIVCASALRGLATPAASSGITQETAGPFSRSFGSIGAAGAVGFLPEERKILDGYKRNSQMVVTSPW